MLPEMRLIRVVPRLFHSLKPVKWPRELAPEIKFLQHGVRFNLKKLRRARQRLKMRFANQRRPASTCHEVLTPRYVHLQSAWCPASMHRAGSGTSRNAPGWRRRTCRVRALPAVKNRPLPRQTAQIRCRILRAVNSQRHPVLLVTRDQKVVRPQHRLFDLATNTCSTYPTVSERKPPTGAIPVPNTMA